MSPVRSGRVDFVDLGRQHAQLREELDLAIARVVDAGAFILGPDVAAFEQEFAAFCDARYAIGVGSGTAAIQLILEALEVGPGDEVIAPANTFIASVLPIAHLGATPVLVDCDPETALVHSEAVENAITPRTRAVIAVHLYGQPADMDELLALGSRHGFDVIEDACQAHGAKYKGKRVGAIGRAGAFSFYPSKNLGALGDGGAITTNDSDLADRIAKLRDLGQARKYEHVVRGHNERLDTLHAAVLRVKLAHLDEWNEARRRHASEYAERLADTDVTIPVVAADREHVWHLYVVRSANRDELRERLAAQDIQSGLHYPVPVHLQKAFGSLGQTEGAFPAAEAWSREGLSLPMFAELESGEIAAVVRALG